MLKKLLKYDLKSVFKYWWIAAVTSFGISFIGGIAISILRDAESEESLKEVPVILEVLATSAFPFVYLSFAVLAILTVILVFARYYKNFFSDEGYLTFTLPVKKTELINSKLITGALSSIATVLMIVVDVLFMLVVGFIDKIIEPEFWTDLFKYIGEIYKELGAYTFVYALEIIVISILATLFSNLFLYDCIAFASMLVKKAKVITAIGIYYVVNGAISAVFTVFSLFGIGTIIDSIAAMEKIALYPFVALIGLGFIAMTAMFIAILYVLQYWIVDRKLNLS